MQILTLAKKILKGYYLCDTCLGSQFGQFLTGWSNKERGKAIRMVLGMQYEEAPFQIESSNLHSIGLRKAKSGKPGRCSLCNGFFDDIEKCVRNIRKASSGIEFSTFAIGCKMDQKIIDNEGKVWERGDIRFVEPIKNVINREVGRVAEQVLKKVADEKGPDVFFVLNLSKGVVETGVNPLFVCGRYKKLSRDIPQTRLDGYKESVEEIISPPFRKAAKGTNTVFHGAGREDIDVRCLDGRPFVLAIEGAKKRSLDLSSIRKQVNKSRKVKIGSLRFVDRKEVARIKELRPDKTYKVIVGTEGNPDLKKLGGLVGTVRQQTPKRVLPRRADVTRKREVRSISTKRLAKDRLEITLRVEAGLYVKEFVTGDGGRTKPCITDVLGPVNLKSLDVVKIHL